jgi:hypothetical protein
MFDPNTIRLNETLYRERLQAAEQARQRRATWISGSHVFDRLRLALGRQLMMLGLQIQRHAAANDANP